MNYSHLNEIKVSFIKNIDTIILDEIYHFYGNMIAGCLIPRGPAGITRRKSVEIHRKYRMKITHFGSNSKVDHCLNLTDINSASI